MPPTTALRAGARNKYRARFLCAYGQRHSRSELTPHFPSIVDIQCGEKAILL